MCLVGIKSRIDEGQRSTVDITRAALAIAAGVVVADFRRTAGGHYIAAVIILTPRAAISPGSATSAALAARRAGSVVAGVAAGRNVRGQGHAKKGQHADRLSNTAAAARSSYSALAAEVAVTS